MMLSDPRLSAGGLCLCWLTSQDVAGQQEMLFACVNWNCTVTYANCTQGLSMQQGTSWQNVGHGHQQAASKACRPLSAAEQVGSPSLHDCCTEKTATLRPSHLDHAACIMQAA